MLLQFNFKNYKSFKDEASLDMTATKDTEFRERVVQIGNEKILPVAVIFGANASGKSNVYSAFRFMSDYVLNSFGYGDDETGYVSRRPRPFLLDENSSKAETSFEVYFTVPGDTDAKTYNYGFSLDNEGVAEEWLNTKAKTARTARRIFYRDLKTGTLDLKGLPKSCRTNLAAAVTRQALIVSLGAKIRVQICRLVRDWFLNNRCTDYGNPVTNLLKSTGMPQGFADRPEVRADVVRYISSFDESITDFGVERVYSEDDSMNDQYRITAIHRIEGTEQCVEIPLGEESAGTLKMFSLYPDLQKVMKSGGVYFVDELNARLHPLLLRTFVLTFLNPEINQKHAQLIFTSHDTGIMRMFRRDEIWFTEKDSIGASSLYSLSDVVEPDGSSIRKDENYERNYLLGKYGAIPAVANLHIAGE